VSEAVGHRLPNRVFGPLTRTDIVRYQGASGDFNPIHHDEEFARGSGAPTVFSVGMLQAGYLATYCVDLFGAESVRRFGIRFLDRVWPGDMLECSGAVGSVEVASPDGPDRGRICVELSLRMTRGTDTVASGSASFAVDDLASLGALVPDRRG
jgi:acyl dehydratase